MNTERREFLNLLYKGSLAATLGHTVMPMQVYASDAETFSDYKALVYVMLQGGNDAFNMLIPTKKEGDAGYDNYAAIRNNLVIAYNDLSSAIQLDSNGRLDLSGGNPYDGASNLNREIYRKGIYHIEGTGIGINSMMPELAQLMREKKLAPIASIGTLVEPLYDPLKNEKLSGVYPEHLFAHNHQRKVQETGKADDATLYGWIGRMFDAWQGVNGTGIITQNISFSGNNHVLVGQSSSPLLLAPVPSKYDVRSQDMTARQAMNAAATSNPFEQLYKKIVRQSFSLVDTLADIWENSRTYTSLDAYGNPLFSIPGAAQINMETPPEGDLIQRFEAVAKMVEYGQNNGLKRQVFFILHQGYDTHSSQLDTHPRLLRELSLGLDKFQKAMDEIGMAEQVTTFTSSDFGRSLRENGDGTDHGWAGHNLVMGGAVNGGTVYGTLPQLSDDVQSIKTSRVIPTLAVEQQFATLTKWFGVDDTANDRLFPNLKNFDVSLSGRDLGFMK